MITPQVHIYFEWEGRKIGRNFGMGYFFGNYNVFTDNVSEFTFKAIRTAGVLCHCNSFLHLLGNSQTTKVFAIPKQKILKILKNYPDIFSKMVANSRKNAKSLREILVFITFFSTHHVNASDVWAEASDSKDKRTASSSWRDSEDLQRVCNW